MIILGIDPGSRKLGYAYLKLGPGRKISYLKSGVFSYDSIENYIDRLGLIYKSGKDLISGEIVPDEIAIESLIYVKSPTALIKLSQARGAMLAALIESYQGRIFEYSPNLVKSSTSGHGHSSKENLQKFIRILLGKIEFKTHDESDAVAVALCHLFNRKQVTRVNSIQKINP